MKNKKIIYILFPFVILIWGTIMYKIFSTIKKNPNITSNEQINRVEINTQNQNDTFSIFANYSDPFLGKQFSINSSPGIKKTVIKKEIPTSKKNWPEIKYNGTIKNQQSKKELALLQISGTEYLMKTNDLVNEITLLKIFRDSIIVAFEKERKTVVK